MPLKCCKLYNIICLFPKYVHGYSLFRAGRSVRVPCRRSDKSDNLAVGLQNGQILLGAEEARGQLQVPDAQTHFGAAYEFAGMLGGSRAHAVELPAKVDVQIVVDDVEDFAGDDFVFVVAELRWQLKCEQIGFASVQCNSDIRHLHQRISNCATVRQMTWLARPEPLLPAANVARRPVQIRSAWTHRRVFLRQSLLWLTQDSDQRTAAVGQQRKVTGGWSVRAGQDALSCCAGHSG